MLETAKAKDTSPYRQDSENSLDVTMRNQQERLRDILLSSLSSETTRKPLDFKESEEDIVRPLDKL